MEDKNKLVSEWEQMGSSTGAMLGRFIGLAAETGLRALDQVVLTPLANTKDQVSKNAAKKGVNHEESRANAWSETGRQYGEKMGNAMGIAMDSAIEATKSNILRPMEQTTGNMNSTTEPKNKDPEAPESKERPDA